MRHPIRPMLMATALILAPGLRAIAAPPPFAIPVVAVDITIRPDGTATQTTRVEIRIGNDAVAQQAAQVPIPFSPSMESLEIVDSYTLKPDGRKVAVTPEAIHVQAEPAALGAPMFSDRQRKVVVFPEVAGGDTLVLNNVRVGRVAQFAGHFQGSLLYPRSVAFGDIHVTVRAPTQMRLRADTADFKPATAEADGVTTYDWEYHAPPPAAPLPAAITALEHVPHVVVSTIQTWEDLARAYKKLADPKTEVTPKIQALANEVTAGVDDRRQQAKLLYNWVSQRVRYVAVVLGNGGLEPHAAETVIANGYGDCKDHVALFEALLRAKGIPSVGALINLANNYALTGVPAIFVLDHIITYIPEFDLYADTTAGVAPFGVLPFPEYGKPVVHVVETGEAVHRTPVLGQEGNRSTMTTTATLFEDGKITGHTRTEATGAFAVTLRSVARGISTNGSESMAQRQLKLLGESGTGHLDADATPGLPDSTWIEGAFALAPWARMMEGGEFAPPTGLRMLVRPGDTLIGPLNTRDLPAREPTPCFAGHQIEELTLSLPQDRKVARLPKDREVAGDGFRFTSHWALNENVLTVRRDMVSSIDQPLCQGKLREQTGSALGSIRRDYEERIRFEDAP